MLAQQAANIELLATTGNWEQARLHSTHHDESLKSDEAQMSRYMYVFEAMVTNCGLKIVSALKIERACNSLYEFSILYL